MLVPLKTHFLLLPNPTIAEVIPMPTLAHADESVPFEIGRYQWQNEIISVFDIEGMIGKQASDTSEATKLCILHGINTEAEIPFYALPCYGSAQLMTLDESSLHFSHDINDSDLLFCQIKIGNKTAFIPNLDNIELNLAG
jgi:chemosensory pili system protein ChpC